MMISKFVSKAEAINSQTAVRKGISNEPSDDQLEAMKHVAANTYDKVKEAGLKGSIFVSSFFRSLALNKAIGGSSVTSQHMKGEAIDIDGDNNLEVFNFLKTNVTFDQLILEYPNVDGYPSWVHVSLKRNARLNRGQVLVKLKSKYILFSDYKLGQV